MEKLVNVKIASISFKGRKQECRKKFLFSLLHQLVLKGLFMSVGTRSNEMLGQFVNSDVVFQGGKKTIAGNLLEHFIFYFIKLVLKNLFFLEKSNISREDF